MAEPPAIFPVEQLRPLAGQLEGFLFENLRTGLARDVFFSITIPFAPIPYGNEIAETCLLIEWLRFGGKDWRSFSGNKIEGTRGIEASFYLFDHRPAKELLLEVLSREGLDFDVRVRISVDLNDRYDLPTPPMSVVDVRTSVRFCGIRIAESLLRYDPLQANEARRLLEPFVAVDLYEEPRFQPHSTGSSGVFALKPRSPG
jgi:hypothetical protein